VRSDRPLQPFTGTVTPGRLLGQRLAVAPADAEGVDLAAVTRVELVPRSARGHVWLLDVSAVP
jgi:hypothetical protein